MMNLFFSLIKDEDAILPDEAIMYIDFESKIKEFIFSLKFPYSSIFELKINGFTNKDISVLMDYPLKKVTNDISRLRKECYLFLEH